MPAEYSDEALHIVKTIKHLRFDLEDACLLNELLIAFDEVIDEASSEKFPPGVMRSANAVQKSLILNLMATLTRAHEHWNCEQSKDRMCLEAIFKPVEEKEELFRELVQSKEQKRLFDQAKKGWDALDHSYSYHIISLAIDKSQGKISNESFKHKRDKLKIKKVFKGPRDEILAHNLPNKRPSPTKSELRSLLSHTLTIVGPLSEAFAGVSVSFDSVIEVSRNQANEYWKFWKPDSI